MNCLKVEVDLLAKVMGFWLLLNWPLVRPNKLPVFDTIVSIDEVFNQVLIRLPMTRELLHKIFKRSSHLPLLILKHATLISFLLKFL